MRDEDGWLVVTDVLEYCYCPRFVYFEHVLGIPEHQELRYKVQAGREVHERRARENTGYLREKLGVREKRIDAWMASERLRGRGRVDEILFLADGTAAPLDYKYAEWGGRVYFNHVMQAALYGLMIRENFKVDVPRGFLVYVRSANRVEEIALGEGEYRRAEEILTDIREVLGKGKFPRRTPWRARCVDCCYRNICVK